MTIPSPILASLDPELRRLDRAAALAPELDEERVANLRPLVDGVRNPIDELARELENATDNAVSLERPTLQAMAAIRLGPLSGEPDAADHVPRPVLVGRR